MCKNIEKHVQKFIKRFKSGGKVVFNFAYCKIKILGLLLLWQAKPRIKT